MSFDDVHTELVRSRAFIRGAETQLTKALDALGEAVSYAAISGQGGASAGTGTVAAPTYAAPQAPVLSGTPADTSISLSTSAFSADPGDTHASTDWQIDAAGEDFATPLWESDADGTNKVAHATAGASLPLVEGTNYIARCRHTATNGGDSAWSNTYGFTADVADFSDGFESGDFNGGVGITWSPVAASTIQSTTPRTGTYSMRVRFPASANCADPWVEPRWAFTQIDRRIWIDYWIYLPANYKHRSQSGCADTSTHHKLFSVWGVGYGGSERPKIVLELWRDGSDDDSELRLVSNMNGSAGSFQQGTNQPAIGSGGAMTLGAWNRVRIFGDTGTAGDNNAAIKIWLNDVVTHDITGMNNSTSPGLSAFYWDGGYLMGYSNGGYDEQTDFYIDDFVMHDVDPGW
jgi:hypothetical protein